MGNRVYLKQIFTVICLCCLSILSSLSVGHSETSELLYYHPEGGCFAPDKLDVTVGDDGSGVVALETTGYNDEDKKTFPQKIRYKFQLSGDELEALKFQIRESDLFSQPDKDTQFIDDSVKSVMRISLGGKKREIAYSYRPEMYSIQIFLYKLVTQAKALDGLNRGKSAYEAYVGISPGMAEGHGILQPYVFLKPIREFIHTQDNPQQLSWALRALSILSTPEEWLGFWSQELKVAKEPRQTILLNMLCNMSSTFAMTKAQHKALAPLLFECLRQDYPNWPQLSDEKREAYWYAIRRLREERYTKAAPVFADMIKQGCELRKLHVQTFSNNILAGALTEAVAAMGYAGIEAAESLLADPRPKVRELAVDVLSSAVPSNSETIYLYSGDSVDVATRLKRLRDLVPKLKQMAESDPDPLVASSAKRALERIEKGYNSTENR